MKRKYTALAATTLAMTLAALPALAAGESCAQINRILSTQVLDNSTMLVTLRDMKQFTVRMRGVCIGFDRNSQYLSFRTQTQSPIGCIAPGDTVSYNVPGERTPVRLHSLQTPCYVGSVTEGPPPAK
jgi:endonuclease YncB( thermonuclease family)